MLCKLNKSFSVRRTLGVSLSSLSSFGKMNVNAYSVNQIPHLDLTASKLSSFTGDLFVLPFYKPSITSSVQSEVSTLTSTALKQAVPALSTELNTIVCDILDEHSFNGDKSSTKLIRSHGMDSGVKYVALVGMGSTPKATDNSAEAAAGLGRKVAKIAKEISAKTVAINMMPDMTSNDVNSLMLGIQDALYVDERFKKVPEGGFPTSKWESLTLLGCSPSVTDSVASTADLSRAIASGVHFAKDLVGAPSCSKTPVAIAEAVRSMAKEYNMEVKVLGQEECEALGMGSYLGVQQGSRFLPQFVHLTYRPVKPSANTVKVALVGKGLTFDSGGYNLKAGAGSMIELMKMDMGGCAAVFGAAKAIGQLRPEDVEVHFISAVCENMVSAEAMRPGDVLVASNGKTIEVINTDAEGRLTLADALVYAENLQVDAIVDLATLTGASIVGLGDKVAALYSADPALLRALQASATHSGEKLWHMPLEESYTSTIKGSFTDLRNLATAKGGGSITAALFLREFVEKTPWAHIDMAGPVWADDAATGFGVKILVDYLMNAKK